MDGDVVRRVVLSGRRLIGDVAVADVHVGGAVGREHEARVRERILGVGEREDAVVAGEIELLQVDGVGGLDVGIAGAAVEAAAAALEVHHQLGGIAGTHQELVGRAVGAGGGPAGSMVFHPGWSPARSATGGGSGGGAGAGLHPASPSRPTAARPRVAENSKRSRDSHGASDEVPGWRMRRAEPGARTMSNNSLSRPGGRRLKITAVETIRRPTPK